jgi:hypothetical protein
MTEYCSEADVEQRLKKSGYSFFVDDEADGVNSATEVAGAVTTAIQWAGTVIDEVVQEIGCQPAVARGAGNVWLKFQAIDLASYRVSTNGGGEAIETLKAASDAALAALDRVRGGKARIPGLVYNYPFRTAKISSRFPSVINVKPN